MKIEIIEKCEPNELKFPCLMKSKVNGKIILVIHQYMDCFHGVRLEDGDYDVNWISDDYIPFHGSITLSNE